MPVVHADVTLSFVYQSDAPHPTQTQTDDTLIAAMRQGTRLRHSRGKDIR